VKLLINIAQGIDYGFPRELPQRLHNMYQNSRELKEWFLECGYPQPLFEKNVWTIAVTKLN